MLAGFPLSYFLWYRPLYRAMRYLACYLQIQLIRLQTMTSELISVFCHILHVGTFLEDDLVCSLQLCSYFISFCALTGLRVHSSLVGSSSSIV